MRLLALGTLVLLTACGTTSAPHGGTSSSSARVGDECYTPQGPACVLNPAVTPDTIRTTICVSGWTSTVRPSSTYTGNLKVQQLAQIGFADQNPTDYEEDHRLPLELGGDPKAVLNLSPEPHPGSSAKDTAENAAKAAVCTGGVDLRTEQRIFVARWLLAWPGYAA